MINMIKTCKIKTSKIVYIDDKDTCGNPYRLTPYVTDSGDIWLAAEGSGNGDDIALYDLGGWTHDDIVREYGLDLDIDAMREDADEIEAAGYADLADWLRSWCDDYETLRDNA